jgi:hypothetical protein
MTRWLRILIVCAMVGVIARPVGGAYEGVGAIFSLGSSGRGLGMGGAFMALVDDEGAVLYNPAALGRYEGIGITSLLASGFGGIVHGVVGFAMPYFGVNAFLLDSGAIPTDAGSFRYASQGVVASLGVPIGPVALGVRGRLLRISSPTDGRGWAVDPSILVALDSIRVGLLFEGALSGPVVYESGAEEAWDRSLRLGAAITLSPTPDVLWSTSFEAVGLFSASPYLTAGLEAWIGGLGARVGFDGRGPTFGLSVRFASLQFDWAYAMRSDLGDSHRVSFTLRF